MSRRVHRPVPVEVAPDGSPLAFTWHDVTYRVTVIGKWHLMDRWWQVTGENGRSSRYYWRVQTRDFQVFELYLDVAQRPPQWVLDIIQD